jgi:hypothetical protein
MTGNSSPAWALGREVQQADAAVIPSFPQNRIDRAVYFLYVILIKQYKLKLTV